MIPSAVFEDFYREVEADQSFDMNISLNQQEQQDSSLGLDSLGDQSLREFRYIEQVAAQGTRKSMELPRSFPMPVA